ncbi:hypothetical protein K8R66_02240 [bacterium]|nr:hypothetical protein [bacterium]
MSYPELELDKYPIVNQTIASLENSENIFYEEGIIFSWAYFIKLLKKKDPAKSLKLILPLLREYLKINEDKRIEFLNHCQKAIKDGSILSFNTRQNKKELKVVFVDYATEDIFDYLFYKKEVLADVIVLFKEKGLITIRTKKEKNIDLLDVIAILRVETARRNKVPFDQFNKHYLNRTGVMEGIDHWNFNLSKGSIIAVKPVNLDKLTIKKALLIGLDLSKMSKGECPSQEGCRGKKCSYYSYNMLRCRKRRAGVKDDYQRKKTGQGNIRVLRK